MQLASDTMRSAIFKGSVWHQRFQPTLHKFRYRVFMMYVDLAEIDAVLAKSVFWGTRWYHPARFKRTDYFTVEHDVTQSIEAAVRQEVRQQIDVSVDGPICLLSNFRYFGYNTNPISCYYCFDADATSLLALLIEVTNTPWGEKHHYVLDLRAYTDNDYIEFEKKMHVSPFMPMDRIYRWRGAVPSESLRYSLASLCKTTDEVGITSARDVDCGVQFDSGVVLKREEITGWSLNTTLLLYPLMTVKVIFAIYWQALLLWVKKVPFISHPAKSTAQ